jgi:hypothetical protein
LAASDWQLGDLLAAKLGRSQTPTAELGQSSMRSVPGDLCQVFGCCLFSPVQKSAAAAATDRPESNRKIEDWAKQ